MTLLLTLLPARPPRWGSLSMLLPSPPARPPAHREHRDIACGGDAFAAQLAVEDGLVAEALPLLQQVDDGALPAVARRVRPHLHLACLCGRSGAWWGGRIKATKGRPGLPVAVP